MGFISFYVSFCFEKYEDLDNYREIMSKECFEHSMVQCIVVCLINGIPENDIIDRASRYLPEERVKKIIKLWKEGIEHEKYRRTEAG